MYLKQLYFLVIEKNYIRESSIMNCDTAYSVHGFWHPNPISHNHFNSLLFLKEIK